MRKALLFFSFIFCISVSMAQVVTLDTPSTAKIKADTVSVGIYVTSIHDVDFKAKEYEIHFWIWLKYKNPRFNFSNFLEIPNAKSFAKLQDSTYAVNDGFYTVMKFQCTMKDSWKVSNYPFDRQTLRFSFESTQFNIESLVFAAEKFGQRYDSVSAARGRVLSGWNIDSFRMSVGKKEYKTNFGDPNIKEPKEVYSNLRVRISISRPVFGLFLKTFLGMYIAFLIAFVCFFIHTDSIDSRFSLSVGSLFAVIGNKYIIDSSLPETTSFTLVDTLHGITLFVIFIVVGATAISLRFIKQDKVDKAKQFDRLVGLITLSLYIIANIYFIVDAIRTVAD